MYGTGLNSIPVRFAILIAVCCMVVGYFAPKALDWLDLASAHWAWQLGLLAGLALPPTALTFHLAGKLAGSVRELKASTEAILKGDAMSPIEVDCACEVGDLAVSFRKMRERLNANIMRMNLLAYHDVCTELPNRRVIEHVLSLFDTDLERKSERSITCFFVDLDRFKRVNDTLGHQAGDQLLRLVARRLVETGLNTRFDEIATCTTSFGELCSETPNGPIVGRFAGDEFVAILPKRIDREQALKIGKTIVDVLTQPFDLEGQDITLGASVGFACLPQDTEKASDLLKFADLAMYRAKREGRGRVIGFDEELRQIAVLRPRLEAELRQALEKREFVLHYQPKLTTGSLAVDGVEALVRWQHPERGLLSPGEFIDIAEQSGLIAGIGHQVLEIAAEQAVLWERRGRLWPIAVNISPAQFADEDIVDRILGVLQHAGTSPGFLEVEITESMAMDNTARTVSRLERLRAAGLRLALDDFGVGFSNLSMLVHMPFDQLKLDRSLIAGIGLQPKNEAIITAVLGMAEALGHKVVAEGIETQAQLDFLDMHNCNFVQGFFFCRPMPARALENWADSRARATLKEMPQLSC